MLVMAGACGRGVPPRARARIRSAFGCLSPARPWPSRLPPTPRATHCRGMCCCSLAPSSLGFADVCMSIIFLSPAGEMQRGCAMPIILGCDATHPSGHPDGWLHSSVWKSRERISAGEALPPVPLRGARGAGHASCFLLQSSKGMYTRLPRGASFYVGRPSASHGESEAARTCGGQMARAAPGGRLICVPPRRKRGLHVSVPHPPRGVVGVSLALFPAIHMVDRRCALTVLSRA
ncbi:hypothetical protein H696_00465 [Fonticula alba]|uniref:Uncharacterized protein n=1 Tax=Fonticula alba TaxID=691883 RepID=A0A058ZEQ9_FONAL|nr:hypothetical protein H696_00465 [Fonticula alba]KCV72895.1 hypothetical protein H696_00465 [Fonticula alba]|eukprot:XP_009492596.1 hypothetical protein H696_00465 [Fonticula alba]